jgi:ribosomal-protein-alanine N-acetyltransferase
MEIVSARLRLVPASVEVLEALIARDTERAGALLGAAVPPGWPRDDEARAGLPFHLRAIRRDARAIAWRIRVALREGELVGSINLKGLPQRDGTVEIGWGIVEEQRRRGLALEGAAAVMRWVFSHDEVARVIATIPAENVASQRVAARLAMTPRDELRGTLQVWEIARAHFAAQGVAKRDRLEA